MASSSRSRRGDARHWWFCDVDHVYQRRALIDSHSDERSRPAGEALRLRSHCATIEVYAESAFDTHSTHPHHGIDHSARLGRATLPHYRADPPNFDDDLLSPAAVCDDASSLIHCMRRRARFDLTDAS